MTDGRPTSPVAAEAPLFSVIVPIRNEAQFIERTLASVAANDYPPERVEIIVVDGMSDDDTWAILERMAAADPRIRLLRNPKRVVPSGMNIGIRAAAGELVMILGGHAELDARHISEAVRAMQEHPDAWRVGGVMETVGTTYVGKVIAAATSHPVGVGGNVHRTGQVQDGYCQDVPFPVVRRWFYDKVGLFDEQLVRNQDTDLTLRALAAGCVSYLATGIRSKYFPRTSFRKLFRQHFMNGYFRIRNIQKSGRPASPRQVAPLVFVLTWIALIVGSFLWWPIALALAAFAGLYVLALLAGAVHLSLRTGWRSPPDLAPAGLTWRRSACRPDGSGGRAAPPAPPRALTPRTARP